MPVPTDLEVRNLRFDLGEQVPRSWHGAGPTVTTFFDNLSVFFPHGERFFIASVRAHVGLVHDAHLLGQIQLFCRQEGIHSREHARYNRMLGRHGYPVQDMERRVERLLGLVSRLTPLRWQLSATCALEHFTALLGQAILENDDLLADAHPVMADLWRWHAVEENEHKGVAFDVYELAGGNLPERALVMAAATLIFWAKVGEQQARMMAQDGTAHDPREWATLLRFLFVEPGGMWSVARRYLEYYRPGFHPWDIDTRALLQRWRARQSQAAYGAAS